MIDESMFVLSRAGRRWLAGGARLAFVIASLAVFPGAARAGVPTQGSRPYIAIASGTSHTCAVLSNGTVKCWGSNAFGQVGTGIDSLVTGPNNDHGMSTEDQPMPQPLPLGSCVHNDECGSAQCSQGVCTCATNCPSGGDCSLGLCTSQSGSCNNDGDCPSAHCNQTAHKCTCSSNCPSFADCIGGSCAPMACTTHANCIWGYGCTSNLCVPWAPIGVPAVPSLSNVVGVAAGDAHSCALLANGTVKCWGENSSGQLGTGSYNNSSTPVQVSGIGGGNTPAIAVVAGAYHTCALLGNGTVKCWGDDNQYQLGTGQSPGYSRSNTPVTVLVTTGQNPVALTDVTAITAGSDHTCALVADGSIKCWGGNANGQIGDGTTTTRYLPTGVSGIGPDPSTDYRAIAVAAGRLHTCALILYSSDGYAEDYVVCWGYNGKRQLGADYTADQSTPVGTMVNADVRAISANGDHSCALLADGTVKCWGDNEDGETGDGSSGNISMAPTAVSNLSNVGAISTGYFHSCAALADGTAKCWGNNWHSQVGDNALLERDSPSPTVNGVSNVSNGWQIATGTHHTCALLANGSVKCWGYGGYGQNGPYYNSSTNIDATPIGVGSGVANAISICTGGFHTCALIADGTVKCWGDDERGQLGDGYTTSQSTPTATQTLSSAAVQVSCGYEHTCALIADGSIQCWGDNAHHQVDSSSTNPQTSLTTVVDSNSDALGWNMLLGSGGNHTCAIQAGAVNCWGYNNQGQLGVSGTPSYPAAVGLSNGLLAKSLGAGHSHSCAVISDGTARCWGWDGNGQLGDNNNSTSTVTPVTVSGLSGAVSVAGGYAQTCSLLADGTFKCWGLNDYGQLGDSSGTSEHDTPVAVSLSSGAVIACGGWHTCASIADGTASCWGYDFYGQRGQGSHDGNPHYTPATVQSFP